MCCASLGRAGQDATPCAGSEASICGVLARATSASLRHRVEAELATLARPSIALGRGGARESPGVPPGAHGVDDVLEARARYVARGVSTPKLVVARADGAQVEAADGTIYLDFAGGIACQNTGHGFAPVVAAIHEQVDRFLHQCFMVGTYEPYVEVCRRLAEHSPCAGSEQKSILVNSGAEAIENAVKIARAATGRPAVVVFDNGFHGRTLLTMAMTSKVRPYKAGFGPFPGEIYRAAAPYPYRGIDTDAAIASLEHLFKSEVDAESVACVVLETVQGEGGFIADAAGLPAATRGGVRAARDPLRRRRGAVGRGADRADVGDRALRGRRARSARVGQVARRRPAAGGGHGPRGGHGRPRARAASAGLSGATPSPVPRPRSCSTRSPSLRSAPGRTSSASRCAPGSTSSLRATSRSGRCAASARCSRSSCASRARISPRRSRPRPSSAACSCSRAVSTATCSGCCPRSTSRDEELDRGLGLLEESLAAAG